jgi:hypothetical protein
MDHYKDKQKHNPSYGYEIFNKYWDKQEAIEYYLLAHDAM